MESQARFASTFKGEGKSNDEKNISFGGGDHFNNDNSIRIYGYG